MPSKKLMSNLHSFSGQERKRFRKFLHSPYFNENDRLIQLFDLLSPELEGQEGKQPTKEVVWKKIYDDTPYKDSRLRRLLSDLNQLAYRFRAIEALEADPTLPEQLLLPQMRQLGLDKHFAGIRRSWEKTEDKLGQQDAAYHLRAYEREEELYFQEEARTRNLKALPHFEQADYHLDAYFFSRKLKHFCTMLDYKKFSSVQVDIQLPEGFLGEVKRSACSEEPAVKAYFLVAQMLLNPEVESHYSALKAFLHDFGHRFSPGELNTLYIYLKNYCIDTKINKGRGAYFEELFDIYTILLEKGIILSGGVLDPQDYKNIITVALRVEAFDWVETFIQEYTPKLPLENQENALNYNLAQVYFHQRAYDKVVEQLREVEYKNLSYALGGKLLLLKTYYELDETLVLDSLAESFRIYLRRNKAISRDVRQQYLNVLRFIKKLAQLAPGDKKGARKIRQQIDNTKELADKPWILEKVKEAS